MDVYIGAADVISLTPGLINLLLSYGTRRHRRLSCSAIQHQTSHRFQSAAENCRASRLRHRKHREERRVKEEKKLAGLQEDG